MLNIQLLFYWFLNDCCIAWLSNIYLGVEWVIEEVKVARMVLREFSFQGYGISIAGKKSGYKKQSKNLLKRKKKQEAVPKGWRGGTEGYFCLNCASIERQWSPKLWFVG